MSLRTKARFAVPRAKLIAAAIEGKDTSKRTLMARIRDARAGQPGAARWDTGPRSSAVWCFTHETDHRKEGAGCPHLEPVAEHSDPTGTAATDADRARYHERRVPQLIDTLDSVLDELTEIAGLYEVRPPNQLERSKTARANEPHCESCGRIDGHIKGQPWWVLPHVNGSGEYYRTTVGDTLTKPMWLCKWCLIHVGERGCLPNKAELTYRRDNGTSRRIGSICPHPLKTVEDTPSTSAS